MNYFEIMPLLGIASNLLLAIYVIAKGPGRLLNTLFASWCAMVLFASVASFGVYTAQSPEQAVFFDRMESFFFSLSMAVLLYFFLRFTRNRLASRMVYAVLIFIPALFFAYIAASTGLLTGEGTLDYWGYFVGSQPLASEFMLYAIVYISLGLLVAINFYRKTKSHAERKQSLFIIVGTLIFLVSGTVSQGILPEMGYHVPPLTTFISSVQGLFVFYAIFRYKLMSLTPAIAAERIIETMADYLVVADKEKKIAFTSKSAGNALGYRKEEMAGKDVSMVFAGKGTPDEIIGRLSKSEYVGNVEAEAVSKKGGKIPVSVNATVVSGGGETLGYVLLMHDMRETKKLIKGMEEKTKLLESRTVELELSKKKLEAQISESERLNKLAVGRELKMVELKKRISTLEAGK